MNRRIPRLGIALLAAAAVSAHADVLVTSFETSPVISGTPDNPPYLSVGQSSAWASEGNNSLAISFDGSGGWKWIYVAGDTGGNNYFPAATYADWYNHTRLEFDVYRPALNYGWNLEVGAAINGPQGWNQQAGLIGWTWQNAGDDSLTTVTWDYSAIRNSAPAPGGSDWWQLALFARTTTAGGGMAYIDNVRFVEAVPEPTAMGLLLLAGSAGWLGRRRRVS